MTRPVFLLVAALILPVFPAGAASLTIELKPFDRPLPTVRVVETGGPPDMLPDGIVVRGGGAIRAAWFTGPTRRYAHGVLGDAIEASGLAVETARGKVLTLSLAPDAVFEDRIPRLVRLNPDGRDDLLVVKSYVDRGAALALAGIRGGKLSIVAETDPVGLPNRWLNPVGAADFDGDGRIETAHVETPHIGGILVFSRLIGARLQTIHRAGGFSNHRMGSRELGLSAILDVNGDGIADIILPDQARAALRVVTFAGGVFRELVRVDLGAEVVSGLHIIRDGPQKHVAFALSDGRKMALTFPR